MLLKVSFIISFVFGAISIPNDALAWKPWDQNEANQTVECAAVYYGASYAVRNYRYETNLGQSKQEIADHFQRLSNILRYFASNSGYEEKMKEKVDKAFKEKKAFIDEEQRLSALKDDIEKCDMLIDTLYASYAE